VGGPAQIETGPAKPLLRFTESCNYLRIRVKITRKINGNKEIHIKRCNLGGCVHVFLSFVCVRLISSCSLAAMLSIFIVYLIRLGLVKGKSVPLQARGAQGVPGS